MRVRHLGQHYATAGRGAADAPWRRGEVRELPDDIGRYLLGAFPGLFVADAAKVAGEKASDAAKVAGEEGADAGPDVPDVVTPAVAAPPVDRAMRSGRAGGRPVE